jgi:serine O-acetyltransferase
MTDAPRPVQVITSFKELRARIREDYRVNDGFWRPGFQAVATYRLGTWCNGMRSRLLRAPMWRIYWLLNLIMCNVYGIEIGHKARIGRRLRIVHQHGITIHQSAALGDDCLLRQGVTIGALGGVVRSGIRAPQLGNRIKIGAGAILAGPIHIGDDVMIGPNAVVMVNVPAGSIVASPQSRVMTPPPRRKVGATPEPAEAATIREDTLS